MAATTLSATVLLLHAAFILLSGASETRCYWCGPLAEQVHRSRRSAPCGGSDHVTVCEPGYNYCAIVATSPRASETRCYWCGPLAEQVHRSRRSAPCGGSDHVTVCEPGYNYCTIVATSPPRVESRYCVKVYQDECYPLYCNSTKTWKMTCPCRGDLCNGPNTEREIDAFAILPKLVAKTHNARINKRTANPTPHLIKHEIRNRIINSDAENINSDSMNNITNDNKLIVTENNAISNVNENLNEQSENMQSDQPTNIIVEHHSEDEGHNTVANMDNAPTSTVVSNQLIEIEIHVSDPTEKPNTIKEEQPCTETPTTSESSEASKNTERIKDEQVATASMASTAQTVAETGPAMKVPANNNAVESETLKPTVTAIETKPSEKPHAESPVTTAEIMSNEPVNYMDQMQNDAPLVSPTTTIEIKATEVIKMDESPTKDTMKASSGVPTAEALQQNGSPSETVAPIPVTEKPTEPTTTATTTVLTTLTTHQQIATMTTTPATRRKNNSVRITFSNDLILLICLMFL